MTFYEAALRVLEEAGAPLHLAEITKRSLDQGLLSHIGKLPEVTMLSRLSAMAKRPRDRRIMVTAKDTFALTDWMLNEDSDALAATGVVEPNPEEGLPPYRPTERHPEPRAEYLRSIGRQAERLKRRDDDGKRRKYPPIAEVVFEQLSEGTAFGVTELLARLREREVISDELAANVLLEALAEDNQRRVDQGRRPQFVALKNEQGELQLSVEAQPGAEGAPTPAELLAQFCAAVGLPLENGRLLSRREGRESREGRKPSEGATAASDEVQLTQTAKVAVKDARRAMGRLVRRRLLELELGTFEKACVKLLHSEHFRELKVAKRSKEGPLLTARRRDGSLELRFAVRVLRGNQTVERRHVQDLRRDLGHSGAHVGLIVCAGDTKGDARAEATQGALVMLWCGDALGDRFVEAELGVLATKVALYEFDPEFFEQARVDAEESQRRRDERHKEREQDRGPAEAPPAATPPPAPVEVAASATTDEGDDGDDEGPDEGEAGAGAAQGEGGAAGEGRRRRRRRRRRRGQRPDGATGPQASAGEAGAELVPASSAPLPASTAPSPTASAPTPAAPPSPPIEATPIASAPRPPPPPPPSAPSSEGGSEG